MRALFLSVTLLFCGLAGFTQRKEITIGAKCPDIAIGSIINFSKTSAQISDFRGKLLIIDFWSTWCRPCVASFPKIDSLQKKFGDKIQILPVTSQSKAVITSFLKKMENIRNLVVPSITDDQELGKVFPHTVVPHCVWINGEGNVVAITAGMELTASNIQNMLAASKANLPLKKDRQNIVMGDSKGLPSLFPSYRIKEGDSIRLTRIDSSALFFQSLLTGYMPGFPSGSSNRDSTLLSVWNESVLQLYQVAIWKHGSEILNPSLITVDISDSALLKQVTSAVMKKQPGRADEFTQIISNNEWQGWANENTFCYEIKVPPAQSREKFDIMLDELNRYFGRRLGIEGVMEKRNEKYLALVRTSEGDKLATKGGNPFAQSDGSFSLKLQNAHISWIPEKLRLPLKLYPWLENETGYNGMVDVELNCPLTDLKEVNKELSKYGLQFVEKEKLRYMAVIRMKK